MDTIQFQNREFKVREIELPEFGNVFISTNSLNELLLNEGGSYISDEAEMVDEEIFYFVEGNEIELSEEELIKTVNLELR
jgi:hypothetical protein